MGLCTRNDLKYTLELIWESVLGINCAGEQTFPYNSPHLHGYHSRSCHHTGHEAGSIVENHLSNSQTGKRDSSSLEPHPLHWGILHGHYTMNYYSNRCSSWDSLFGMWYHMCLPEDGEGEQREERRDKAEKGKERERAD